ncbi:RabGAP/TBC [Rhodofomes roseus]|uniref:RabGAP/TBC n=1 Tax=Rhodofomes roseus TaxID=34475 RepID=A0ABQ8KW16_9APHY|nr:RabGAP/TBC [Rhodofomes roseus]KAH9843016.1 RabGAP/TBC [Rhodofomes roseus]
MTEGQTRPKVKEIKDAYDRLFNVSLSLSKIKDAALGGRLFQAADDAPGVAGRSLAWKLFLVQAEPLQTKADVISVSPLEVLRAARHQYTTLLLEKMRAPDGSYEEGLTIPGSNEPPSRAAQTRLDLSRNNPLSLDDQNPWTEWFASMELRKEILKDVERTFPDIGYFRDPDVQAQLTNILFIHSSLYPDIGYRQGMHELLAPLYYAVDYDSLDEKDSSLDDSNVKDFCSRAWIAADAWALFSSVMNGVGRWYEWQDRKTTEKSPLASHVQLNAGSGGSSMKPYVAPIVEACNRVQSTYLKSVDPELWKSMQNAGTEPQIYGIRWLRLLFTREFDMHDSMILWDGLFACDPSFNLAEWVCVAMLIRIRNKLIPSDYSSQLTFLLRYPSTPGDTTSGELTVHHATLLLRQALTLQMSPSPTTGVSVIHENRNLLDIPVEVPEPPPPPARRRPRPGDRGQSFSSGSGTSAQRGLGGRVGHSRQQSNPMALPEMLARGLLERGESLGINKTVMNAVSELKRNLPDLANSIGKLPLSPQSAYAAYPLLDERPTTERRSWESSSRFEVERELSELRKVQRRLGDSVEWIVDTLLQDEGDANNKDTIRKRKQEALESLAYVRDVLKSNTTDIQEERLIGEEERKRREAKERSEKEKEDERRRDIERSTPKLPQPAAAPSRPQGLVTSRSSSAISSSHPGIARSPPKFGTIASSHPSTLPSPRIPPSLAAPQNPIAPWTYTRSDFSSNSSPITSLPRIPPPTSTAQWTPTPTTPAFPPPSASLSEVPPNASRDQAPRRGVEHDPLGALL